MTEGTTGSTVPRRQLGRYLRDLRGKARLTVRAAAIELEWSEAKIWRIETGQTSMRSLDVAAICQVYGAPPELTEALKGLAKETKGRGWWHTYGDAIPDFFDLYIGLEEAASEFQWYEGELVPGLLQTGDYARLLMQMDAPEADEDEIERRVHVRVSRQSLLTRPTAPPTLQVALNEAVLRRPVGGRAVMAGQLSRLQELAELPNVDIRVLPFRNGLHHGVVSGPFVTLRFPADAGGRETEPPVVYIEGMTGALYLDKPQEVDRYDRAFGELWDTALNSTQSKNLLATAVKELTT